MKKLLVYLLILILALPIISPWGTITYFVVNRDYIKTVLCINKNRPELKCDGTCYLAKKLKKQQETAEKEATDSIKGLTWTFLYFQEPQAFHFTPAFNWPERIIMRSGPELCKQYWVSGIFRPPRV